MVKDYYSILSVKPDSNIKQIRKSFRQKAKKLHPDTAGDSSETKKDFLLLLEAYEVLVNVQTRDEYDTIYRYYLQQDKFDYRKFLLSHQDDTNYQVRLLCYDLLNNNEHEAVSLYDKLVNESGFDLLSYLDREDFMDYAYIIAEEYMQEHCYIKAFKVLKELVRLEAETPYFKHFFPEVVMRLREIGAAKISGDSSNSVRLQLLEEIVTLGLPDTDTAFFYKQISKIYFQLKDFYKADQFLGKAVSLDKNLTLPKRRVRNTAASCG